MVAVKDNTFTATGVDTAVAAGGGGTVSTPLVASAAGCTAREFVPCGRVGTSISWCVECLLAIADII